MAYIVKYTILHEILKSIIIYCTNTLLSTLNIAQRENMSQKIFWNQKKIIIIIYKRINFDKGNIFWWNYKFNTSTVCSPKMLEILNNKT